MPEQISHNDFCSKHWWDYRHRWVHSLGKEELLLLPQIQTSKTSEFHLTIRLIFSMTKVICK
jgi:hypothetical protein